MLLWKCVPSLNSISTSVLTLSFVIKLLSRRATPHGDGSQLHTISVPCRDLCPCPAPLPATVPGPALKPSIFVGTNLLPGGTYRDVYVNSVDFAVPWWAVLPSSELRARWAADGPYTEPMDSILPFLRDTVCFGPISHMTH